MYTPYNSLVVSPEQLWPRYQSLADFWFGKVHHLVFKGAMANANFYRNARTLLKQLQALGVA